MLYTPHFLTGAAILKTVPNPYLGLPLALLSHLALDMLPHYDFDIKQGMNLKDIFQESLKKGNMLFIAMGVDFILLAVSFFWLLTNRNPFWLISGGLIAISPDVLEQSFVLLGRRLPDIQDKFQNRVSAKWGFISYPIVCFVALLILL